MELKVRIRTPEGYAGTGKGAKAWLIKNLLFRRAKIKKQWISPKKDEMVWHLEVHVRHYLGIIRNITMFNAIGTQLFKNRRARQGLRKLADSQEDYDKVVDLITNGTQVEVIKEADAKELMEVR